MCRRCGATVCVARWGSAKLCNAAFEIVTQADERLHRMFLHLGLFVPFTPPPPSWIFCQNPGVVVKSPAYSSGWMDATAARRKMYRFVRLLPLLPPVVPVSEKALYESPGVTLKLAGMGVYIHYRLFFFPLQFMHHITSRGEKIMNGCMRDWHKLIECFTTGAWDQGEADLVGDDKFEDECQNKTDGDDE